MSDFVDRVVPIFSSSSTGQVRLTHLTSIEVSAPENAGEVKTMHGIEGYSEKTPDAYGVSMEVAVPKNPSEEQVDWYEFRRTHERFSLSYREGGTGIKRQLARAIVLSVSDPYNTDGEMRRKVEAKAIVFDRVPGA